MNPTRRLLSGLAILAGRAPGDSPATSDEAKLRDRLGRRVYRNGAGRSLPYRLFVPPDYDSRQAYPLILFLHGAGERGSDNEAQLTYPEVLRLVTDEANPCFLVAPQCPRRRKWVEVPWNFRKPHRTPKRPSLAMQLTIELVAALEDDLSIDPQRRYVTGVSMGGFGTFDLLVRRPHDFAAAVPICGGADESRAERIAHVPTWLFHGEKDPTVPVVRSRSAVEALQAAGGDPQYTEYKGMDHNVWSRAYLDPQLREWLFGQRRRGE
jgi:predicted peptidase